GFSVHQFRAAARSPTPNGPLEQRSTPRPLATAPLILAGVGFSATALADPAFPTAAGVASQEQRLAGHGLPLVAWSIPCRAPLVAVIIAAAFGKHEQVVTRVLEVLGPRRRALQRGLAVLLALAGLVVLGDGILALVSGHVPVLRQLILLR